MQEGISLPTEESTLYNFMESWREDPLLDIFLGKPSGDGVDSTGV